MTPAQEWYDCLPFGEGRKSVVELIRHIQKDALRHAARVIREGDGEIHAVGDPETAGELAEMIDREADAII